MRAARCRGDAGVITTTVALVTPLMILLLCLVVQYGINYHAHQRAAAAADRAVSVARWSNADAVAGQEAGLELLLGSDMLIEPDVQVTETADEVEAVVSVGVNPLVPFASWTVTAHASAPVEQFIPEPDREGL